MTRRHWLSGFVQDLRFGARILLRSPVFTVTTVLTLALATGATTAIFSIVNSVLLRPLPFPSPDRLVQVAETWQIGDSGAVVPSDLDEFRRQSTTFEAFAGYGGTTRHLKTESVTERLTAVLAEGDFFRVLGVAPIAGRTFRSEDRGALAVISARLWRERFGRSSAIIDRPITLTAQAYSQALQRSIVEQRDFVVLGVMPEHFQFPYGAAAIVPGALPESRTDIWIFDDHQRAGGRFSGVAARVKPGVAIEAAGSELATIKQRIDAQSVNRDARPTGVRVRALSAVVLGPVARLLWILVGAVSLVLVAACANVANLLLARTALRRGEVAARLAIGADRTRLAAQFLTESLLISFLGAAVGVAVAWWGTNLLVAIGAAKIPRAHEVALDWSTFGFLAAICLATAFVFGLAPALTAARSDVHSLTKEHARFTAGRGFALVRDGLVVVEIALAFVLAVGAASIVRELDRLLQTEIGMVTDNVLTFHLTPRTEDQEYFTLEARVKEIPGIEAAGFTQLVPLQNWGWIGDFEVRGRTPPDRRPTAELRTVTPGYFEALGIPIRAGRPLSERDSLNAPRVIAINDALARQYFPGEDPIGRETNRGAIVAVVGDVRQLTLDRPPFPEIYQVVSAGAGIASDIGMSLLVKTSRDPSQAISAVRAAVREINPGLAIFNIRSMDQVVADSVWELNLYRWLIGLFSLLAVVLSAIGLYGVISYGVTSRTQEFAVRMALGSEPAKLARFVVRRGLALALLGLTLGAAMAFSVAAFWPTSLQRLTSDRAALAGIAGLLLAIALGACLVPAVRVARVDPASSLRHD